MARSVELPGDDAFRVENVSGGSPGLILFIVYFILFCGFVVLNVFSPATMKLEAIRLGGMELSLRGQNLAIVYGVGLIFAAFIMALMHVRVTRAPRAPSASRGS